LVFIENGENLGFAKGNNVGIRFGECLGTEWVMLLNNDTVVAPEMFRELQDFVQKHPSFLAITPQIRYYSASTRIQNCGGDLTYFGSRKYKFANCDVSAVNDLECSGVTFVTGCALLFNFQVLGALTEDFFFGEEDYEFSLRVQKLGFKMACAYRAVVFHKVGSTITKNSRPLGAILVQYISRLINTRTYYSRGRWQLTRILAYCYLPLLLAKNGIGFKRTTEAIARINTFVKRNRVVDRAAFKEIASLR
jgi:GT2 family glycosyltransferase